MNRAARRRAAKGGRGSAVATPTSPPRTHAQPTTREQGPDLRATPLLALSREEQFDHMARTHLAMYSDGRIKHGSSQVLSQLPRLSDDAFRAWLVLHFWARCAPGAPDPLQPTYQETRKLAIAYTSDPAAPLNREDWEGSLTEFLVGALERQMKVAAPYLWQQLSQEFPQPVPAADRGSAIWRVASLAQNHPLGLAERVMAHIRLAVDMASGDCLHDTGTMALVMAGEKELALALRSPDGFLSYMPGDFTGRLHPSEVRNMRAFVASYQGPTLEGGVYSHPQSRRLCALIGLRVEEPSGGLMSSGFLEAADHAREAN